MGGVRRVHGRGGRGASTDGRPRSSAGPHSRASTRAVASLRGRHPLQGSAGQAPFSPSAARLGSPAALSVSTGHRLPGRPAPRVRAARARVCTRAPARRFRAGPHHACLGRPQDQVSDKARESRAPHRRRAAPGPRRRQRQSGSRGSAGGRPAAGVPAPRGPTSAAVSASAAALLEGSRRPPTHPPPPAPRSLLPAGPGARVTPAVKTFIDQSECAPPPAGPAHAHSLALPSSDPVAKVRPSGLAATE